MQRLWRLVSTPADGNADREIELDRKVHKTIAAVGANIETLTFNKAVANLYELAHAVERAAPSAILRRAEAVETIVLLVAPMVPHIAEEAWAALGKPGLIADAALAGGRSGAAGRERSDDSRAGQRLNFATL